MPGDGTGAALYLILVRVLQGIGGAMIMANSTALLTDAFPAQQRGLSLGTNMIAAVGGNFLDSSLAGCWRTPIGTWCSGSTCRSAS